LIAMRRLLAAVVGIALAVFVGWLVGRAVGLHHPLVAAIGGPAAGAGSAAWLGHIRKRQRENPQRWPIPLNGAEVAILCGILFFYGIAIGLFAGAMPHPTLRQLSVSILFMLAGTTAFVCFAIWRINKEWRIRTTVRN
jgi:membrane protein DedA with SNARE-associated domain